MGRTKTVQKRLKVWAIMETSAILVTITRRIHPIAIVAGILSVNVGLARPVTSGGQTVTTGIFKAPVSGRIRVRELNLEGDGQADLSVRGGPNKAVYAYPTEHYAYWRGELDRTDLPWEVFGENLTIEGLLEDEAHIGD